MPTYVYRCKKGHTFELFHSIADDTPKRCPKCRSGATRVPSGGSGLLFKGSGFYITDYRSSGYKESAKQERGAGSSDKPAGAAPAPAPAPAPSAPAKAGSESAPKRSAPSSAARGSRKPRK